MNLRDALIYQTPSLELQRAAQAEIARLDALLLRIAAQAAPQTLSPQVRQWDSTPHMVPQLEWMPATDMMLARPT